jgi:transcriptional regulator GlxA family with amidase domain
MHRMRHAFLLLPRFSLLSLASALDTLTAVGHARGGEAQDVLLTAADSRPVAAGSGAALTPDLPLADLPRVDALHVVSDAPLPERGDDALIATLRAFAATGATLGGIGTGAYLLARAGVLDGYRATLHWPYVAVLAERFPGVVVSTQRFERDGARLTAAGGTAAGEMLLAYLHARLPALEADAVAAQVGLQDGVGSARRQQAPAALRAAVQSPKLAEAVALMEANVEEPLPTEDIARLVGVSRRQLERLFKQHLQSLPSRYYLELRLLRAHHLLRETGQSILQVGLACGFSSGPHFSSAYRNHFGITPREERAQRVRSLAAP